MRIVRGWLWLILPLVVCDSSAWGQPPRVQSIRSREFMVPPALRRRVDFWIHIFTRYGKDQVVVHHRRYPWLIFEVFDFSAEAAQLGPIALEKHRNQVVGDYLKAVKIGLEHLAAGNPPVGPLESKISVLMQSVPGGSQKYQEMLRDDLLRTQTGIKEKWMAALKRSGRYMHIMEEIFRAHHLPVELTRLPFIESSFDYYVKSSAGAVGLWQFMPATGRHYMTINYLIDERRDVMASTRAAARYLQEAYRSLGSWPLAITSYNHGVGGVGKKIREAGTDDIVKLIEEKQVFGFASANFYPEFLAALEVYDHYRAYFPGLVLDAPLDIIEFPLPHATGVFYLCEQLGLDRAILQDLNHALSPVVWDGRFKIPKGYHLKVPASYAPRLGSLRIPEPVGPSVSAIYGGMVYRVRAGDTLIKIAKKYGTSVAELMRLNKLESNKINVGQKLIIKEPERAHALKSSQVKDNKVAGVEATEGTTKARTYRVRKGDSLWSIGRKLGVKLEALQKANKVDGSSIKPGQLLTVP